MTTLLHLKLRGCLICIPHTERSHPPLNSVIPGPIYTFSFLTAARIGISSSYHRPHNSTYLELSTPSEQENRDVLKVTITRTNRRPWSSLQTP